MYQSSETKQPRKNGKNLAHEIRNLTANKKTQKNPEKCLLQQNLIYTAYKVVEGAYVPRSQ